MTIQYPYEPEIDGAGGYVRWRPRMVRQSVFEDMKTTLSNNGYLGSTPSIALNYPVDVVEFFPEFAIYDQDTVKYNTIAVDNGEPGPLEEYELGGIYSRDYRFNMALYAENDGIGLSLFSDLGDRYLGLTNYPFIPLYNYNATTPSLIVNMEVLTFGYTRAPVEVAPYEHHLFFGELILRDFVQQNPDRTPQL
jgi:hypothetical protein